MQHQGSAAGTANDGTAGIVEARCGTALLVVAIYPTRPDHALYRDDHAARERYLHRSALIEGPKQIATGG